MTDRPIIFSGPMVRALLDGSKSMTRRLLKPQPDVLNGGHPLYDGFGKYASGGKWRKLGYAPGDRLYVRENWSWSNFASMPPMPEPSYRHFLYFAADGEANVSRWSPSIHMPRWASRLTLEVTGVKVERLQDISVEDAKAEGCGLYVPGHGFITESELNADPGYSNFLSPRMGFEAIWFAINEKRAPWESNPWVVAVTFKTLHGNIDSLKSEAA